MVQIVQGPQRKQSFGQKFSNAIGAGLEQGSKLINEHQEDQAKKKSYQDELEAGKRLGLDLSGMPEETRKKAFEKTFDAQNKQKEFQQKFQNDIELQKQKYQLEADQAGNKLSGKDAEKNEVKAIAQTSFNSIVDLLGRKNLGAGSDLLAQFGGDTAEDFGKFQSLLGGLESGLVHLVNTGALSDTRFKYITENLLPKPNDYESVIRGKLEGLSEILGLDASSLKQDKSENKSKKSLEDIFG